MVRGRGLSAAVLAPAAFTLLLAQAASPRRFPGGDHPRMRADWFARFRQTHDGLSPAEHRYHAYLRAQALPVVHRRQLEAAVASGLGDWVELGPRPETDPQYGALGGRIT
ncbi:MAG: hypothetical protein ACRD1L_00840, partial [Terriglobales bacterium]